MEKSSDESEKKDIFFKFHIRHPQRERQKLKQKLIDTDLQTVKRIDKKDKQKRRGEMERVRERRVMKLTINEEKKIFWRRKIVECNCRSVAK